VLCIEFFPSIGVPLEAGIRELRLQEVEKESGMIDHDLGILPQPPAQTCFSVLMALFIWIGTSQIGNWPYSFQSTMEVPW